MNTRTDFYLLSGTTVPYNYSWDRGNPFTSTKTSVRAYCNSTTTFISGYAPGLNVVFQNNTIPDNDPSLNIDYTWNFGDYYNDTNNIVSLSCISSIDHTYIMPGVYNVSLTLTETKKASEFDTDGNSLLCRDQYNTNWYWDNLQGQSIINNESAIAVNSSNYGIDPKLLIINWNNTSNNNPLRRKTWADKFNTDCFQKYCTTWTWYDLQLASTYSDPITWLQTSSGNDFEKKWMFETNNSLCTVDTANYLNTNSTIERTVTKTMMVSVVEIPPVANMFCLSSSNTVEGHRRISGVAPYTVRLTARTSTAGSFPIDRIDWDFDDGTPIKTITRYTAPSSSDFINSEIFKESDPDDIRNYDAIHTYIRNKNNYSVFYPSITCYSSCTNTSDSCCITIGPVTLPISTNTNTSMSEPASGASGTHLLKVRNTAKGNIYTFSVNKNIAFNTTTPTSAQSFTASYNYPKNTLRDSYFYSSNFHGNPGDGYPPLFDYICNEIPFIAPDLYLATENDTVSKTVLISSVPINTESVFTLIP